MMMYKIMQIMYSYICDPLLTCTCVRCVHTDLVTGGCVWNWAQCMLSTGAGIYGWVAKHCTLGLPCNGITLANGTHLPTQGKPPSCVHCAAHSLKSDHRQCWDIDYQSLAAAPLISGKNAPLFSCQLGNLSKAKKPVSLCSSAALFSPLLLWTEL